MKKNLKYFCAVLLLIVTSARVLAADCTYYVWDATRSKWQPFVVQDQSLVVPPAPDRTDAGLMFIGWHIDPDPDNWLKNPTGTYKWDDGKKPLPDVYYIHPIPNTANNDDNTHTAKQGYTAMYAVYAPPANQYKGWTINSGWTAPSETQVTITFKPNEGSPNADKTQKILKNTPTCLSSCPYTRSGYEFAGWGTNSSIGTLKYTLC